MKYEVRKRRPGEIRDAIMRVMRASGRPLSTADIEGGVSSTLGSAAASSVRSYLRLNTPPMFVREGRGVYRLHADYDLAEQEEIPFAHDWLEPFVFGRITLVHGDCFAWIRQRPDASLHAVVTDPPYGLVEYEPDQQAKLRAGKGGVWRIPPSFDGSQRSPLPRFTTLTNDQLQNLAAFFLRWARALLPKLVPGANVVVASNPLLSYIVSCSLAEAGLERRGEIVRLVMTMRGGDRPKAAHREFAGVSVMPRSMWEPWLVYRKPLDGRAQDNLRRWKTGGFRRPSALVPFGDVIRSSPTHKKERVIAPHPSLKPQAFMRQIVRAVLPLGEGVILDPFAGSGSTLSAAHALGYECIGVERDDRYFTLAQNAIPRLAALFA